MTTDVNADLDLDDDLDDGEQPEPQSNETPTMARIRREREKAVKRATAAEADARTARAELAVAKAGLDLNDAQTRALVAEHGEKEMNKEALRETAATLGFITADTAEADTEADESTAGQARIAGASRDTGPAAGGEISPTEVTSWPQDKIRAFMDKRPGDWERILRGENVPRTVDF